MKKILVLYSELMPYNVSAFKALAKNFDVDVHIVYWDHKKLTPYNPEGLVNISLYKRSEHDLRKLTELFEHVQPDMIFTSGWMDKDYKQVCRQQIKLNNIVLCGADNHWTGDIKQQVAKSISGQLFKKYFSHFFVPGVQQYEFVRQMGYTDDKIILGAYTADTFLFNRFYESKKYNPSSKKILFVGRLHPVKGIDMLTNAFHNIIATNIAFKDWKLILVGNGPIGGSIAASDAIIRHDFMDQQSVADLLTDVRFFCLPSRKEPWGLVVHEMAAAGIPLLLSDACGAGKDFLVNGFNGFVFESENEAALEKRLLALMSMPDGEITQMAERSFLLSQKNSPDIWSYNFYKLLM